MKSPWIISISALCLAAGGFYFLNDIFRNPIHQPEQQALVNKADTQAVSEAPTSEKTSHQANSALSASPSKPSSEEQVLKESNSSPRPETGTVPNSSEPPINLKGTSESARQFVLQSKEGDASRSLEAARKFYADSNGSFASKKAYLGSLLNSLQDASISTEVKSQLWQELVQSLQQAQDESPNNAREYQLYIRVGFAATAMYYKGDLAKIESYVLGIDNKKSHGYGLFLQAAVARKKGDVANAMRFLEEAIQLYPLAEYHQALSALKKDPNSSPFNISLSLDEEELKEN